MENKLESDWMQGNCSRLFSANVTVGWQEGEWRWRVPAVVLYASISYIYSYELQDDRIFRLKDPLIQAHGVRCRN